MNLEFLTYIIYVVTAANTTIFIGQQLYVNGAVFLERIFRSTPDFAVPVNKLLLIGFYLVNIGLVLVYTTQHAANINTLLQSVEFLVSKIGIVYLLLGIMHVFNLMVFIIIEKKINFSYTDSSLEDPARTYKKINSLNQKDINYGKSHDS